MYINNLNPVLFQFGFLTIRWYGLFLSLGILTCFLIYYKIWKDKKYDLNLLYDLAIWLIIGGLLGARLGHIIFYNLEYYLQNPKEIFFINHGGLASHGLTIGLLVTLFLYIKIKKIDLKKYLDILVIPIPLLAFFIRIGNFFNSEIIGLPTKMPWCVYFSKVDSINICRHPSQFYESITGLIIFIILLSVYKKTKNKFPKYYIFHLFLLLYFSSRFLIEFFKARHILFNFPLSMGQILSLPFIIYSICWFVKYKKNTV